jgi:hypothetical protein
LPRFKLISLAEDSLNPPDEHSLSQTKPRKKTSAIAWHTSRRTGLWPNTSLQRRRRPVPGRTLDGFSEYSACAQKDKREDDAKRAKGRRCPTSLIAVIENPVCQVCVRGDTLRRWFDRDLLEVRLQESSKTPWEIKVHQISPRARNAIRRGFSSSVKDEIHYYRYESEKTCRTDWIWHQYQGPL